MLTPDAQVIKLSDAVQPLSRQSTQFVHGVPQQFLTVGEKKAKVPEDGSPRFSRGAYFIGKVGSMPHSLCWSVTSCSLLTCSLFFLLRIDGGSRSVFHNQFPLLLQCQHACSSLVKGCTWIISLLDALRCVMLLGVLMKWQHCPCSVSPAGVLCEALGTPPLPLFSQAISTRMVMHAALSCTHCLA